MGDELSQPWWKQAAAEVWRNKWARLVAIIFFAFEVYNTAILPAYLNTQKARIELEAANNATELKRAEAAKLNAEARAAEEAAANARERQAAEAKLATQKAEIELQTARNAAQLKAAEAAKMEAEAQIAKNNIAKSKEDADFAASQAQAARNVSGRVERFYNGTSDPARDLAKMQEEANRRRRLGQ